MCFCWFSAFLFRRCDGWLGGSSPWCNYSMDFGLKNGLKHLETSSHLYQSNLGCFYSRDQMSDHWDLTGVFMSPHSHITNQPFESMQWNFPGRRRKPVSPMKSLNLRWWNHWSCENLCFLFGIPQCFTSTVIILYYFCIPCVCLYICLDLASQLWIRRIQGDTFAPI